MTARNRLVSDRELDRVFAKVREHGIQIGAIDIRGDGVTIYTPTDSPESDFDRWKKGQNSDRAAYRQ